MQKVEAFGGSCTEDQSESFSAHRGCPNFSKMSQKTRLLTTLSFCFGTASAAVHKKKHFKETEKVV